MVKKKEKKTGCEGCQLYQTCNFPKMEPHGKNLLNIVVIGEAPGQEEDKLGIPFVGRSGQFLRRALRKVGLDLDRDCVKLNIVQCRSPNNATPTKLQIGFCRERVQQQLKEIKPDLIFALGSIAIAEMLSDIPFTLRMAAIQGRVIPSSVWKAYVCCAYHPSYLLRQGDDDTLLTLALSRGIQKLSEGIYEDTRLNPSNFIILDGVTSVVNKLKELTCCESEVAFDYETNCLSPYEDHSKLLTISLANTTDQGFCIPLEHSDSHWKKQELERTYKAVKEFLQSGCPKVLQNWDFEERWSHEKIGCVINNVVCDTMVRQHIIDNRRDTTSLAFQTYTRYGETYKDELDKDNLDRINLLDVARYNVLDSRYTLRLKWDQDKEIVE